MAKWTKTIQRESLCQSNDSTKLPRPFTLRRRDRRATTGYPTCRSTGRSPGTAGTCACTARPTCATGCTPSHCCSAWDGPEGEQKNVGHYWRNVCKRHWWTYGKVALERLEWVDASDWRRITHPLQCLPVVHQPHVVHGVDGVQELDESLLVVRLGEPGRMVEQAERSAVWALQECKPCLSCEYQYRCGTYRLEL